MDQLVQFLSHFWWLIFVFGGTIGGGPGGEWTSRRGIRRQRVDHGRAETRGADLETSGVQRWKRGFAAANGATFERTRMNWANRLTISRLVLTVLFVAMLNLSWSYARTTAFILFLIALYAA